MKNRVDLLIIVRNLRRATRNKEVLDLCDAVEGMLNDPAPTMNQLDNAIALSKKVGRPRIGQKRPSTDKPWLEQGMSRATWYRRQKETRS